MTTYIPSITLPGYVFENPAVSILVPIAAGTLVGYSTRPKETQKTYLALRQPPLRPPPQVFGPVWTVLYGAMGYAAYRAWSTGMNSFDAHKVVLTKVSSALKAQYIYLFSVKRLLTDMTARRNTIHSPTGSESFVDAAILPVQETDRGIRRHHRTHGHYRLLNVYLGSG